MSLVIADSCPGVAHPDRRPARRLDHPAGHHLLENRVFKAGPALGSPAAVRDYLRLKLVAEPNEIFAVVFLDSQHQVLAFEPLFRARSTRLRCIRGGGWCSVPQALNAFGGDLAHQHPSGNTEPRPPIVRSPSG